MLGFSVEEFAATLGIGYEILIYGIGLIAMICTVSTVIALIRYREKSHAEKEEN